MAPAAKDLELHKNMLRKWFGDLCEAPLGAFPGVGRQTTHDAEMARPREDGPSSTWSVTS